MRSIVWLVVVLLSSLATQAGEPAKKPNILFIYADDQSYKTVGCYPESWSWVKTPNLDALAKSGVRFHGAYLGAWCMPSRASLLTGRQPHGIESMRMDGPYPRSVYDPKQCPFWPAYLRTQGYHTAQIGKWHTGIDAGYNRDWDYQIVWNRPKNHDNAGAYYETQKLDINGVEKTIEGYPADNYNKWAVEYVKGANRDKDKPWFLWLCHGSVHGPSKPAARNKGQYKDAKVPIPADIVGPRPGKPDYLNLTQSWSKDNDGNIIAGKSNAEKVGDDAGGKKTSYENWVRQVNECVPPIDDGVGDLVKALKESGQLDNTLIIYTADQGFAMGEHGMRMKIAPYDSNYRSPLIMSMAGRIPAGQYSPYTPNAPDMIATIFSIIGVNPPKDLHGRDFTPLFKDPKLAFDQPVLYESLGESYGSDVDKVLKNEPKKAHHQRVPWYTAVVHQRWKYVRYLQADVPDELYDLASDPEELKNLAQEAGSAEKLKAMKQTLIAELKRTNAGPEVLKRAEQ